MDFGILSVRRSLPLLPCFRKVATSDAPWAQGLEPSQWQAGGNVARAVWRPIALWVRDQLREVVGKPRTGAGTGAGSGCLVMDKRKCRAKGWLVSTYVGVLIGRDANGAKVYERAHRLVAWCLRGQVPQGGLALHGATVPCVSTRCVCPGHISWGDSRENAQEWRDRAHR